MYLNDWKDFFSKRIKASKHDSLFDPKGSKNSYDSFLADVADHVRFLQPDQQASLFSHFVISIYVLVHQQVDQKNAHGSILCLKRSSIRILMESMAKHIDLQWVEKIELPEINELILACKELGRLYAKHAYSLNADSQKFIRLTLKLVARSLRETKDITEAHLLQLMQFFHYWPLSLRVIEMQDATSELLSIINKRIENISEDEASFAIGMNYLSNLDVRSLKEVATHEAQQLRAKYTEVSQAWLQRANDFFQKNYYTNRYFLLIARAALIMVYFFNPSFNLKYLKIKLEHLMGDSKAIELLTEARKRCLNQCLLLSGFKANQLLKATITGTPSDTECKFVKQVQELISQEYSASLSLEQSVPLSVTEADFVLTNLVSLDRTYCFVDGPFHFYQPLGEAVLQPTTTTLLRNVCMKKSGLRFTTIETFKKPGNSDYSNEIKTLMAMVCPRPVWTRPSVVSATPTPAKVTRVTAIPAASNQAMAVGVTSTSTMSMSPPNTSAVPAQPPLLLTPSMFSTPATPTKPASRIASPMSSPPASPVRLVVPSSPTTSVVTQQELLLAAARELERERRFKAAAAADRAKKNSARRELTELVLRQQKERKDRQQSWSSGGAVGVFGQPPIHHLSGGAAPDLTDPSTPKTH